MDGLEDRLRALEVRLRGLGLAGVTCRLAGPVVRVEVDVAGIPVVERHARDVGAWTEELGLPPASFGLRAAPHP